MGNWTWKGSFDAKHVGPAYGAGVVAFDDGCPLYVEAGRGSTQAPYHGNQLNLYADVVCARGRIWFGLSHGLRIWWPDRRYEERPGDWPKMSDPAQVRLVQRLVETIETGKPGLCYARMAYATQEALCALLESGLSHRKVTFPVDIEPDRMERVRQRLGG